MVAEVSGPALSADALEGIYEVDTGPAVQTGAATAVVDVLVTVYTRVPGVADALASTAPAPARARLALATAAQTVVQESVERVMSRLGAVLALPLARTVAVVVGLGVEALSTISTGVGAAVVPVDLALDSGVTHGADALVGVHHVPALAPVLAGLGGTLIYVDLAVLACVPWRA